MPGTFAYDEATNKIEVTDGTAEAPATFNDMFLADQAGADTILLDAESPVPPLIAHYKMNDDAANSTVTDETTNHDGDYKDVGGDLNTDIGSQAGKINESLEFDGGDEYVEIADHPDFTPALTPFSISAWVKMSNSANFPIASKGIQNVNGEWRLMVDISREITFHLYDNSEGSTCRIGRYYNTSLFAYQNQWIHIVATYDGGTLSSGCRIYLNGVRIDDANSIVGTFVAVENLAAPVYIGKYDINYADGLIDDVRFYSAELTQAQINGLYRGGSGTEDSASQLGLTYPVRPTHDKALKVKCVVANKSAEADYIFITGEDWKGDAQTESIDVTAGDGSYETTKYWSVITTLDCSDNAVGGGVVWADGDLTVTQDIWGVVWEYVADSQYKIDCNVDFGDGATSTYFTSKDETVYFKDDVGFTIKSSATLQLGVLSANYGIKGSYWSSGSSADLEVITNTSVGILCLYDSTLFSRTKDYHFFGGTVIINKGKLMFAINTGYVVFDANMDSLSIKELYLVGKAFHTGKQPADFNSVHIHNSINGMYVKTIDMVATDFLVTNASQNEIYTQISGTFTVRDPKFHPATIKMDDASNAIIEQYTCNIHVTDKDGADLSAVDVDCEYAHLVEGSDGKTYKCIQDHISVDAVHKPITGNDWASFWELYDAGGGLGGDWQTTFDFKAGAEEFVQDTTDANGDITEQVIQYKKWVGTSELLEARIHKFTFSHADYPDFVMNDIYVDHPLVWEFDMGQSDSDLTTLMGTAIDNKIALTAGKVDGVALVDTATTLTNKTGFSLSTAGILAIWHQLVAAVVTVSTMGKLLIDFLNASISSRATAAKQNTMETTLTTLARTGTDEDTLKTLSDQIDGVATLGVGATAVTYTVSDSDSNLLDGVAVWVTTNVEGTNIVASGTTNDSGEVTFMLDSGTTYYMWSQKAGYNFTNPDTEVVP